MHLIVLTVACIALLLVLILVVKLHAFLALLLSSMVLGLAAGMPPEKVLKSIQSGFGEALGFIAVVVGLGAMIGRYLEYSGGGQALADWLLARFGKDRAAFEAVLQAALDEHRIDLICLGGFMRLFTAEFVRRWYGRMLNIHPSLLPSFPGLEPQAQALRAGVRISGATVHFVIPETDAGPILMQGAVEVYDDDTPEGLAERILAIEHGIYPAALRLVAGGRIRIEGNTCKTVGGTGSGASLISPGIG